MQTPIDYAVHFRPFVNIFNPQSLLSVGKDSNGVLFFFRCDPHARLSDHTARADPRSGFGKQQLKHHHDKGELLAPATGERTAL
jgi:hypothetical protein